LGYGTLSSIIRRYPDLIIKVCGLTNDAHEKISKSLVFLVPVVLILLSHYIGFKRAALKTQYAVSTNNKNFVLVRTYGELCFLKDFNPETNVLGDNVIIEGDGHLAKENFMIKTTGRLITKSNYFIL
jgi:hypothetical protein